VNGAIAMSELLSYSTCLPESIELSVIINSFNRLQLLRESLSSIAQSLSIALPGKFSILIFDAGSTDGSIEFVQQFASENQEFPLICICPESDVDSSFSAGCNAGIQRASEVFINLKWCLLFETDNSISNPQALSLAIKLLQQENSLAGVGFTVEGSGFCAGFPSIISFILGQQLSHRLGLEQMKIQTWYPFANSQWGYSDVVFTSPMLIRYSAWKATGGMDVVNFPFSDSDSDWCWSAHEKGWSLAILDVSGVIHDNKMTPSSWSGQRVLNFHQARLRLLLKHKGLWVMWFKPLLLFRHTLEFFVLLFKVVFDKNAIKSLTQRKVLIQSLFRNYEI
jgi:GT2 family glycosyltransferase